MPPKRAPAPASAAAAAGAAGDAAAAGAAAVADSDATAAGAGAAAADAAPPEVDERKLRIRDAFSVFDHEGTGTVPEEEVITILRSLDIFVPDRDFVDRVLMDLHGDEPKPFIRYDRFEVVCLRLMESREFEPDGPEVLLAAFKALDPDGTGFIDAEKLKSLLTDVGDPPFRDKEVEMFLKAAVDKDSGRVYYEDYVGLMSRA